MKKRIGILVYDISLIGGAERVALNLAEEFSNKYDVHLISIFNEKEHINDDKYNFWVVKEKTIKIPFHLISLSKKIKKYIKDNKIDILFVITAGINTIALLATASTKVKVVYCEHSNLENKTYGIKHQLRQRLGAKYSDKIVTLTERDKEKFISYFKIAPNKVITIPNWKNCDITTDKYDISSKKIITVGRLETVKGYDMLVKIAKKVYDKHKDWHWDIYGDGSYRQKLEEQIKEQKLEKFITLKGNVKDLYKLNIYQKYSFYVLTSYYEGFSLVLLEAQSAKLPIISFDCPTGPSEIIINNSNGYLIPAYDIDGMAQKINKLIENKKERINFSKNAIKKLDKYSKENIILLWDKLINSL